MGNGSDHDRRRFLRRALMTIAAAHFGLHSAARRRLLARSRRVGCPRSCDRVAQLAAPDRGQLIGKVVVVNFWTYTCINWLRTLPYVRAWAQKYKDHGLVMIGVHTPEFRFERTSTTSAGPSADAD